MSDDAIIMLLCCGAVLLCAGEPDLYDSIIIYLNKG